MATIYNTPNGVKPRFDGGGSEFGLAHRDLGQGYLMFDIDRMTASVEVALELRRKEEGFIEYRHEYGDVKFIALYEIKGNRTEFSEQALNIDKSSTKAMIAMARRLESRLFVVFATNGKQPFDFYEFDTSEQCFIPVGHLCYEAENRAEAVREFWQNVLHIGK